MYTRPQMGSSLRSKILLCIVSSTLIVLMFMAGASLFTIRGFLVEDQIATTRTKLRISMGSLDHEIDRLAQLVTYCSIASEVTTYIGGQAKYPEDWRFKALAAHKVVQDMVYGDGFDDYIDKLIVGDLKGNSIQMGLVSGQREDYALARDDFDYDRKMAGKAARYGELRLEKYVPGAIHPLGLCFSRGIVTDDDASTLIGFVSITVNQDLFRHFLAGYDVERGAQLCLGIGTRIYRVEADGSLALSGFSQRIFEKDNRFVVYEGSQTGWRLYQTLPPLRVSSQALGIFPLFFFSAAAILALSTFVLLVLNRMVNRPVGMINAHVARLSAGDFSQDPSIEWPNELGDIGRAVNRLSRDMEALIANRLKDERERRLLEYQALQNQINPHFLYNTLGAIKLMAEIQKAGGIAEMVGALAALLRRCARGGADGLVSLEQELDTVEQYCTIQRYRLADLFDIEVNFEAPELKNCQILRFTLQPIVENAILHGIEPKGSRGRIGIDIRRQEPGRLKIDVKDDGIGISPERTGVDEKGCIDPETFNGIGLSNVDRRIKLRFGEEYGLSIQSEEGSYTCVSISLPFIQTEVEETDEVRECIRS